MIFIELVAQSAKNPIQVFVFNDRFGKLHCIFLPLDMADRLTPPCPLERENMSVNASEKYLWTTITINNFIERFTGFLGVVADGAVWCDVHFQAVNYHVNGGFLQ